MQCVCILIYCILSLLICFILYYTMMFKKLTAKWVPTLIVYDRVGNYAVAGNTDGSPVKCTHCL